MLPRESRARRAFAAASPTRVDVRSAAQNVAAMGAHPADRVGYAPTFYPGAISAAQAQRRTIAPGQAITGITLALLPIQMSRVSGTVYDVDGKPMGDGTIVVTPKAPAT